MSARKKTKGNCVFCGKKMTAGGLIRHLKTCDGRKNTVAKANENNKKAPEQRLFHLQIKNVHSSNFWLHLEMNGNARLNDLDEYLRAIWLECCGHLSHFTIGNDGWGEEISMNRKVYQLLKEDMELTHVYDFGSSTRTSIKIVDTRRGKPLTSHPIFLMARNDMPEANCEHCDKQAKWLLLNYDSYERGDLLCENHKDEQMSNENNDQAVELIELINSPRCGVCGYTGPATTPYRDAKPIGSDG